MSRLTRGLRVFQLSHARHRDLLSNTGATTENFYPEW